MATTETSGQGGMIEGTFCSVAYTKYLYSANSRSVDATTELCEETTGRGGGTSDTVLLQTAFRTDQIP